VEIEMPKLPGAGCRHQTRDASEPKLRPVTLVQLIAIVTLVLSTLIAATAVSIGLARADVAPTWPVQGKLDSTD
jgi:hypothetical protein